MRLAILLYAAVVLQTTWLAEPIGWAGGARLDLPLVVIISIGLARGWRYGASAGLAVGLMVGIASGYNVGSFALSRLLVGGLFGIFDQRFSRDNPLAPLLCMAGGTLLAHIIFGLMSPVDFAQPWLRLVCATLLNTVVGCALHLVLPGYLEPPRRDYGTQTPVHPV